LKKRSRLLFSETFYYNNKEYNKNNARKEEVENHYCLNDLDLTDLTIPPIIRIVRKIRIVVEP
jgi:hypothetical protein